MVVTTSLLIKVGMGFLMVNLEEHSPEDSIGDEWKIAEERNDHSSIIVQIETTLTIVGTLKDTIIITPTVARLWDFTIKNVILVVINEATWKHYQ